MRRERREALQPPLRLSQPRGGLEGEPPRGPLHAAWGWSWDRRRRYASGTRFVAASLALACTLLVAGHAGAAPLAERRLHDAVTVDTRLLAELTDRDPGNYRLYAARGGAVAAVPFQIDPRDAKGRLLVDGDTQGVGPAFDGDDALVFMAKDAGERVAASALPARDAALELEISDPESGARGFAYFVHDPTGAAPAGGPYATYDRGTNRVDAASYSVRYPPGRNFLTELATTGVGGSLAHMLVSRMSLQIAPTFSMLVTDWSPRLTEESFTTVIEGVRNGPVRAIVRARQSLDLGKLLPDAPAGDVFTFYYPSAIVTPSTFRVPALVLQLLRAFEFEGKAVLDPSATRSRYVDADHPDGVALATAPQGTVNAADPDWFVIDGPGGTYLHAFAIPEIWRRWGITRASVLREAEGRLAAGYSLRDMTRLQEAGAYDLRVAMVVLGQPYRRGDERPALAMLDRPLDVAVRPVAAAEPATGATAPSR